MNEYDLKYFKIYECILFEENMITKHTTYNGYKNVKNTVRREREIQILQIYNQR